MRMSNLEGFTNRVWGHVDFGCAKIVFPYGGAQDEPSPNRTDLEVSVSLDAKRAGRGAGTGLCDFGAETANCFATALK
jgi:hypothetical protein